MPRRSLARESTTCPGRVLAGALHHVAAVQFSWVAVRRRTSSRVGMQQLEMAAARGRYLRPFTKIILALAALQEKKAALARIQLEELVSEFPQNPLFVRELAKLEGAPKAAAQRKNSQEAECGPVGDRRERIASAPANARSSDSAIIAHWESVGTARGTAQAGGTVIVFASVVTVPPNARALPVKFAKCPIVIPAASMMVPTNVGVASDGTEFAPNVVAPMGAQNTPASQAPLVTVTRESCPVVRAPPGLKI